MKTFLKNQNNLFWIIQILSWSVLDIVMSLLFNSEFNYSLKYEIASFFSVVLSFVIGTSVFRWFIKKWIFNNFYAKTVPLFLLGFVLTIVLIWILNEVVDLFTEKVLLIANESDIRKCNLGEDENNLSAKFLGLGLLTFGWSFFYFIIKLIIKSNQDKMERLQLKNSLRDAQLNTLKGQINPHFMFNSLNNIRGLMLEDVDRSRDMITKLSDMLRYSLTKNGNDAILLEEELEMVDNYIALSKTQMEDRLQFIKQIDKGLESISIPPMLIQLLVENAAKHGIANQKNGGVIKLLIKKENEDLIIEVINTGTLNIAKNSTKLGLKNIEERLRLLYGEQATFSLEELNNEVIAQIKIKEL